MKGSSIGLVLTIIATVLLTFFVYPGAFDLLNIPRVIEPPDFRLGLDLQGGTHLQYEADLEGIENGDQAMEGVRDVIERRVNLFGIAEPLVQVQGSNRLIVELAGISDVNQAIALIGETPSLEFKEPKPQDEVQAIIEAQEQGERLGEDIFLDTGLTGQYLKRAQLVFDQFTGQAQVSLELDETGAELFGQITERNLGQPVAIYLDGQVISLPIVQSEITTGQAVISGNFTIDEARTLAQRLNAGALPVPITLVSQQTIGPSLGATSLAKSLQAGLYGLIAVAIFMMVYYRLPGAVSVIALAIYVVIVLAIYKAMPVTLTLAGIAGFILSLGIAVDANVLIFARMREELKAGKKVKHAVTEGFRRAWSSIRDGHVTTLLGALVLYLFTTSIVKGFALTLGIGVLVSLFTSVVVSKALLERVIPSETSKWIL